ncbi:hypothetical protein PAPHI01_0940 [Pancytospora philotis]|nr:hypothetical protein PAPHI01_0940 [Pancytospora philotis]
MQHKEAASHARMSAPRAYKKLPQSILVCASDVRYEPKMDARIDYQAQDCRYDLVVYVDLCFRMQLEHPFSIADAEIWYERGTAFTQAVFERALNHYSECEIRNGK